MKLYKFRTLGDDRMLTERVEPILATGNFWCSRFWDLNDPMEGVYRLQTHFDNARAIFHGKTERAICSFSAKKALRNPLMWGYYANGFKGLAVEVEADDELREVRYTDDVVAHNSTLTTEQQVDAILCNKLKQWKHEDEWRFLTTGLEGNRKIGKITAVVLGVPYPDSILPADREGRMIRLEEYRDRLKRVEATARARNYRVHLAFIEDGQVEIKLDGNLDNWGVG